MSVSVILVIARPIIVVTVVCAGTLEPTYRQLQTMKLDKSPFVIISVIGQELLAQARYPAAVTVLESALKIGTCSLKLRGSVFSALSSAYWALNTLDKVRNSASKSSIRRFVITEKAPTRAFSWLKVVTTAFTFKTLLRHYAKWALTPRSLNMKLGPRHKGHKGRGWLA